MPSGASGRLTFAAGPLHGMDIKQRGGGGGVWHKASVSDCLPLVAPIGLSPLHILTLCGSERVLVVSTEPPDDLSCLTTPGVGRPGDGTADSGGGGGGVQVRIFSQFRNFWQVCAISRNFPAIAYCSSPSLACCRPVCPLADMFLREAAGLVTAPRWVRNFPQFFAIGFDAP